MAGKYGIRVPIVELNMSNFDSKCYRLISDIIDRSVFCSIDFELSGLGTTSKSLNFQERYESVKKAAQTRAILSVGLSFFVYNPKSNSNSGPNVLPFEVYIFDAKTLSKDSFVIEPKSAKFLIKHGFDFNRLFQTGLFYGAEERNDIQSALNTSVKEDKLTIRLLILRILRKKLPIILHNGFCDLLFLYQNFFQDLPERVEVFQQDVHDLFRGGVFDTKYMAFDSEDLSCSYLSYVFKKTQRSNVINQHNNIKFVQTDFPTFEYVEPTTHINCGIGKRFEKILDGKQMLLKPISPICEMFAQSGYCLSEPECPNSHNVDDVLDAEYYFSHQRSASKIPRLESESEDHLNSDSQTTQNDCNSAFGHRAGFDSFITGFCFAFFLLSHEKSGYVGDCISGKSSEFVEGNFNIDHVKNKVASAKRTHPFCLMKSNFAKMSTEHLKKSAELFSKT